MRFPKFKFHKPGTAPGTLFEQTRETSRKPTIQLLRYDASGWDHLTDLTVEDLDGQIVSGKVNWIQVTGMEDNETLLQIGQRFNLHPLALEDLVNPGLRPKLDVYDDHYFVTARSMLAAKYDTLLEEEQGASLQQVGMFFNTTWVLTFQQAPSPIFSAIEQRIKNAKGRIRKQGTDYLGYAVLDTLVDNYFPVLEEFGKHLESIEDELLEGDGGEEMLESVHKCRRVMMELRHAAWPMREVVGVLARDDAKMIKKETRLFFRDVQDNLMQAIDMLESYREIVTGLLEISLSKSSAKTNDIIRVLTVFATILMPLTFITSLYGMNFKDMPELSAPYGYATVWVVMIVITVGMFMYFKRKGWI